jgi:cellulose synthase/poly-beta-1,6-N-acetylglucosamine synthase-like glycosyltransferase
MEAFLSPIFYVFTFCAVYVEVFFLMTYIEGRKDIVIRLDDRPDRIYPSVTIIVPCWNEETTVGGTVRSLLALDYPKDKIKIILVDDGSTDGTWKALQEFAGIPNIDIMRKENGGKHTAMNLGIEKTTTDLIGCLDADSFVTPSALKRIVPYFDEAEVMAVSPSIIVNNPKRPMEWAQKVEYQLSVYLKKMLGLMNGIHVTPGPFSIYRTKVFTQLGPYREAHKTEDMEIAFRMHEAGMRIEQCHDAVVYTKTPGTPYALYKQRKRWIYGFINNVIDYRRLVFRSQYGAFALFTIPAGILSIFSAVYLFIFMIYTTGKFVIGKILEYEAIGVHLPKIAKIKTHLATFDWFFVSTHSVFLITILLYGFVFLSLMIGSKMATGKWRPSIAMVWYIAIYSIIAPIWIISAVFNTITRRETSWR